MENAIDERAGSRWKVAMTGVVAIVIAATLAGFGTSSISGAATSNGASTQKLTTRPTHIAITTPVSRSIPTGKAIDYVECTVPGCSTHYASFASAAKLLGWTVHPIVAQPTPASIQVAFTQVINDHPAAVVSVGYSKAEYLTQWNELVTDHITNVAGDSADPSSPAQHYYVIYGAPYNTAEGARMADFAYAKQGSSLRPLVLNIPSFAINQDVTNGFVHELKKLCAKCESSVIGIDASAIGTTAGSQVVGYVQGHPGINAIYATYDALSLGLSSALNQAGLHGVKLYGSSPGNANFANIADGTEVGAYLTPVVEDGYQFADLLARLFAGDSPAPDEVAVGQWILTKSNIPSSSAEYIPIVANYASQFKALWKKR